MQDIGVKALYPVDSLPVPRFALTIRHYNVGSGPFISP